MSLAGLDRGVDLPLELVPQVGAVDDEAGVPGAVDWDRHGEGLP
ncbi:MAG TPA: hypothetical protein VGC06_14325 [Actinomycetes bacterium]